MFLSAVTKDMILRKGEGDPDPEQHRKCGGQIHLQSLDIGLLPFTYICQTCVWSQALFCLCGSVPRRLKVRQCLYPWLEEMAVVKNRITAALRRFVEKWRQTRLPPGLLSCIPSRETCFFLELSCAWVRAAQPIGKNALLPLSGNVMNG